MKAFPQKAFPAQLKEPPEFWGMDLRDWFAGQALMSMLSAVQDITESTPSTAARYSYKFADAMMKARSNENNQQV